MRKFPDFESWKKILENDKRTVYERSRGIKNIGYDIIQKETDICFVHQYKSDGTTTLKVLIKLIASRDEWFCWTPTKKQALTIKTSFASLYDEVEASNKRKRSLIFNA